MLQTEDPVEISWLEPYLKKGRSKSETWFETGGEILQKKAFHYLGGRNNQPSDVESNQSDSKIHNKKGHHKPAPYKPSISMHSREAVKDTYSERSRKPGSKSRLGEVRHHARRNRRRMSLRKKDRSNRGPEIIQKGSSKWHKMISLRPILKVRNKIRDKAKSKSKLGTDDGTTDQQDEESFVEELRKDGQFLE